MLYDHPEVQAQLERILETHYATWPEHPLPALNGQTPREAVQSAVGREKVEALIDEIERSSAQMRPAPNPAVFERLRARLGLD